jgi:hypothetical protein
MQAPDFILDILNYHMARVSLARLTDRTTLHIRAAAKRNNGVVRYGRATCTGGTGAVSPPFAIPTITTKIDVADARTGEICRYHVALGICRPLLGG